MATQRKKFASQLDVQLLHELKSVAGEEGKLFQAVLEDAVRLYLQERKAQRPRASVLKHFRDSLQKNRRLAHLLAQ